jgi:hypothetical protein
MEQSNPELISLSASRIKAVQNCSWLYHAQYNLRIPQESGEGASVGSSVHTVLECLALPRRRKMVEFLIKKECLTQSIERLLERDLIKRGYPEKESLEKAILYVKASLKQDFFFKGSKRIFDPELKFDITDEQKRFRLKGFIDNHAEYDGYIKIRDWKTAKNKFGEEDLSNNLQALIYQWVIKKLYGLKSEIEFVFVKFIRNPIQKVEAYSDEQFKGFEDFLTDISKNLKNFTLEDAKKNFAANGSKYWLCGKESPGAFCCAYRKPCTYFAQIDKDGNILRTAFKEKDLKTKPDTHIIKKTYQGCDFWNNQLTFKKK